MAKKSVAPGEELSFLVVGATQSLPNHRVDSPMGDDSSAIIELPIRVNNKELHLNIITLPGNAYSSLSKSADAIVYALDLANPSALEDLNKWISKQDDVRRERENQFYKLSENLGENTASKAMNALKNRIL